MLARPRSVPSGVWMGAVLITACSLAYHPDDLSSEASGQAGGHAGGPTDGGGEPCHTTADCDDHNDCTIDACGSSGCTHAADTGAKCNDGNPCNAAGTCNASGECAAAPIMPTGLCTGGQSCPGGFYISDYHCDMAFCGECKLCVNAVTCTFGCTPTFDACCGNDCATACPTGYHVVGDPMMLPTCGCGEVAPGPAVTCSL